MRDSKIVVARLWNQYKGSVPSRAPVILGINSQKYHTILIYLMKNSNEPNYFESKGLKVFYISGKNKPRIFNPLILLKLANILKREKVDILHCHLHKASVYGAIAAGLAGVEVVFSHVHGLNRSKALRRRLINRLILPKVNKILTVGEAVRQDVLQSNPFLTEQKVISLGNSIDYEQFANIEITREKAKENLGLQTNSFVFGSTGRLAPTKGYGYLIEAFGQVKRQIPQAELVFAGDGRLRGELERKAATMGYAASVHFLGQRADVPQILRAMDVFVLPSIAEGLPRSLMEAMAAGLLCIGSRVGGVPEILANGQAGYLVEPKNETALAQAMVKLAKITNSAKEQLIAKARQRVTEQYSHDLIIKKLENIYEAEYKAAGD